ncbi:hypothetical protein VE26_09900 [Devosia chinhatensis]|uniref:DUF2971 domain-containing protein n=2 Tax=Devosia chinhatensis TaxID=429727 RepID=A0A0F5FPJ1_9HYPH|nr:hypothetical protein VE26_09900 [Devosia chinhatensis]
MSENPPAVLYKYLVADRVSDVLDAGMVRFTHLLDTNDSFEVRKTFRRFAGPKLNELIMRAASEALTPEYVDQQIQENLAKAGVKLPTALVRQVLEQRFGMSVKELMKSHLGMLVGSFSGGLDAVKSPEEFLMEIGSILLCFSLSERWDIATMWAHYAGNHTGLVIAFDTNHPWFKSDSDPSKSKLQKIKYLDEQNNELFDDLQAALSSKATDWSYEREWRINCSMKQIEKSIDVGVDKIHLRSFPAESVSSVILGAKASSDTFDLVRDVLKQRYPDARLQRANPQRMAGTFVLDDA